jgi:two-component system OmpR family sensor kinase
VAAGDELRRETQGAGIGLSLVKAIAEAHGGTVQLQSETGKGSTFTLRIPVSS